MELTRVTVKEVGALRMLVQIWNFVILQDLQCKEVSENEIKSGGQRAKFEEKRGSKRALFHLFPS